MCINISWYQYTRFTSIGYAAASLRADDVHVRADLGKGLGGRRRAHQHPVHLQPQLRLRCRWVRVSRRRGTRGVHGRAAAGGMMDREEG